MAMSTFERTTEEKVAGLERDISNIYGALDRITNSVEGLLAKFEEASRRGQITWPLIFAFVTTMVAVLSVGGIVVNQRITPIERVALENSVALREQLAESVRHEERIAFLRERGVERGEEVARRLNELDTTIQREMRLLDETGAARVDGMDTVLQREMQLNLKAVEAQLNDLRRDLDEVRALTRDDWMRGDGQ